MTVAQPCATALLGLISRNVRGKGGLLMISYLVVPGLAMESLWICRYVGGADIIHNQGLIYVVFGIKPHCLFSLVY